MRNAKQPLCSRTITQIIVSNIVTMLQELTIMIKITMKTLYLETLMSINVFIIVQLSIMQIQQLLFVRIAVHREKLDLRNAKRVIIMLRL